MFSASSERDPMIDTSVVLAIGKGMDPRYNHRRSGWEVFVKGRWRADGVILECDEEGSQIKDGFSLRCAKGKQHDLECDERKEILNPSR